MPFRLVGSVDGRQLRLMLREGRNRLGSQADSELLIEHPTVSRRHAELTVAGDGVEIVDLGSRNGTLVGSRRISRDTVSAGERLAFGSIALLLERVPPEELEPGLEIAAGAPPASAAGAAAHESTVGTEEVMGFALHHFPPLLQRLVQGTDAAGMAEAGGAALFRGLPAFEVEVTAGAGAEEAVLYRARRDGPAPADGAQVTWGDDSLAVRVVFARAALVNVFRPLVEDVGALLRLASGKRGAPAPAPPPVPAPPEPASVVPEVQRLYAEAAQVARGEVGALICGESGTGKEVLARYIHAASRLAAGPFVALNCAALPRDLLESELFGIERGVATGVEARPGKFEAAHGGTLFLDEIGDMALDTQARILRVLQEQQLCRVGGTTPRAAVVRVLAATNQDMRSLLAAGRFREDLYYRIATWVAELPPLRRRAADIPNLAAHFLAREARRLVLRVKGISRGALERLTAFEWPGNIRQLEKEISRAVLFLADGELLHTSCLSPFLQEPSAAPGDGSLSGVLEHAERNAIARALRDHAGDVAAAAAALGLGRSTLYKRMKALGIQLPGP